MRGESGNPPGAEFRSPGQLGRRSHVRRVSAVVPVYAETSPLVAVVEALVSELAERLLEIRIILAAGAPQETRSVCQRLQARIHHVHVSDQRRGPGLGWAVRQGISESQGTHILLIDGDGEMDVATVPRLVAELEAQQADLVIGSRWVSGGGAVGYGRAKLLLNRAFQFLFRRLYRTSLHDLTLGFKLGRADLFQQMPWQGAFHEIACETTLRFVRAGCKVAEVPTVWRRRASGVSSNPFRRNLRYVTMAVRILLERRERQWRQ